MHSKLLGGGREVGRLGIFNQYPPDNLMVDYGIIPDDPPKYPLESPLVKNMILTHAHLDHSGMIPWLCSRYDTKVYTTQVSADIIELLFEDSIKIAHFHGHPFPYGENEVEVALDNIIAVENETKDIGNINAKFHSAGHIPGSLMPELTEENILFAFDINTVDTHLVKGAKPVNCTTLFIECTYAGNEHPDRQTLERQLIDEVEDTLQKGGKAIIPAFAVGRTQEVALMLYKKGFDIWIDGMGPKVTQIMLDYPQFLNKPDKLRELHQKANTVYSNRGKKIALESGVIITTSGMMNGGPVLWYVNKIKDDPKSAVILTGYQVEGTNGRMLMDHGKINLYGVQNDVNCRIKFYDFSAHAGHSELVSFIKSCNPDNLVLVHSENPEAIAEEITGSTVYIPNNGDTIEF